MITIEINSFDLRNFLSGVPQELIDNSKNYITKINGKKDTIEFIVLFGNNKSLVEESSKEIGATFEDMGFGYGVVSIAAKDFDKIANLKGVQYIEFPKVLTTNVIKSNRASCIPQVWDNYDLSGKGVIVGIIDTGIDYKHPAFIDINKKTRIKYIYDLLTGKIYDENKINEALASPNPEAIVPQSDFVGHGTAVASVAAGGGEVSRDMYGAAYEASIIMVKITGEGKLTAGLTTQLMRGLKFLIDKSNELNMPLSVNISLSTNDGAHNGSSLIEKYIEQYAQIQKVSVVIAAGNEGEAGHHYSATLDNLNQVRFNVGGGETNITLQLYKPILPEITLEVITPSGLSTGNVIVQEGVVRKRLGFQTCVIYYSGAKPFDLEGEISITLNQINKDLEMGVWTLNIITTNNKFGIFDIWLPIAAALNPQTQFLQQDPFNTVGIPATVASIICVGSYNYLSGNRSNFSGRGIQRIGKTEKPDILAPGEEVNTALVGGGYAPASGTSIAAPQVSGICALILEWGLIKGNDSYLFAEKLKYYLIKGANRTRTDITYPSRRFGYGYVCADQTFQALIADNNTQGMLNAAPAFSDLTSKRENIEDSTDLKMVIEKTTKAVKVAKAKQVNKPKDRTTKQYYLTDGYSDFLVEYDGDLITAIQSINDIASAFIIDENYAIVSVRDDMYRSVVLGVDEIIHASSEGIYTLEAISPAEASNAISFHYNPYLNLTGRGTIIGIVDTGIDYLNKDFIKADGTTKIVRLWDQAIESESQENVFFGTEYTEEDINKAIKAKEAGQDPYSIVPSKDINGHGTAMAGLTASAGNGKNVVGVANEAELAIVKLKIAGKAYTKYYFTDDKTEYQYRSSDIIIGVKYLFDLAKKINKPMAIFIPLGSTIGGHDGSSIIEKYIDDISMFRGIVVITSTGNQGASQVHTSGIIKKVGDKKRVELNIGRDQKNILLNVYSTRPDKLGLSIISPSGETISSITPKSRYGTPINFLYEGTSMVINFIEPDEVSGDGIIIIRAQNITPGIWIFELIGEYIVSGKYDAWLVQRELLSEGTRFINPVQYTTLTMPASAENIISVAHYDQRNNSVVAQSGRGYTRDGRIKPIIAAGGIDAVVTTSDNKESVMSGGSVAGAVVTGCCSLLLQWGLVNGNDLTLYAMKIQSYLMRGTNKRVGEAYPNEQWGYGTINMQVLFDNMVGIPPANEKSLSSIPIGFREEEKEREVYSEFYIGNLYVRKPL